MSTSTLLQEITSQKSPSQSLTASLFPSRIFNTDPRTAAEDDGGPFDISELWAAASPAESDATTESDAASTSKEADENSYQEDSFSLRAPYTNTREVARKFEIGPIADDDHAADSRSYIDQSSSKVKKHISSLSKPVSSATPKTAQRVPVLSPAAKNKPGTAGTKTPAPSKTPAKPSSGYGYQRPSSAPRQRPPPNPSSSAVDKTTNSGFKTTTKAPPPPRPAPVSAYKQRAASAGQVRSSATKASHLPPSHYSLSYRNNEPYEGEGGDGGEGPYEYLSPASSSFGPEMRSGGSGAGGSRKPPTAKRAASIKRRVDQVGGEEEEGGGRLGGFVNPESLRMIAASYPLHDSEARIEQLAVPKTVMIAAKTEKARDFSLP